MTNRRFEKLPPRKNKLQQLINDWAFKNSPYRRTQKRRNAFAACGTTLLGFATIMYMVNPAGARHGVGSVLTIILSITAMAFFGMTIYLNIRLKDQPKK